MYWISRYEISTIFLEDTNVNAHPHSRLAACMTALSDIITVSTWSVMPKYTVLLNKRQHLPLVDAMQRCMQSVGWEHWRHVPAHFSSSFALEAFLMIRTWQRGFLMFCGSLHPPLLSPIPFHSRRSGFILGDSVQSQKWTNWVPSAPSRSPYSIQPSSSAFRIVWSHLAGVWISGLGSHPSSLGRILERHRGAYWGLANYISCTSPIGLCSVKLTLSKQSGAWYSRVPTHNHVLSILRIHHPDRSWGCSYHRCCCVTECHGLPSSPSAATGCYRHHLHHHSIEHYTISPHEQSCYL